jgi:type VI secretion system protein ImpI
MALRLTIENFPQLPDGGPISFTVTGKRSVDIGRDQHLDWTLPDPTRFVSGKHCEIHYKNDAYWLHDVSTNGTFLNGSDQRMRSPHLLKNGDRLVIGQYIVGVVLDGGASMSDSGSAVRAGPVQHAAYPELWANDKDAPPPIDRQQIKIARESARPINPDFLDWAAGVPGVDVDSSRRRAPASQPSMEGMDWASGVPSSRGPAAEPPPPVATPRRPVWKDEEVAPSPASPFVPATSNISANISANIPASMPAAAPAARPEVAPQRPAATLPPPVADAAPPRPSSGDQDEADAFVRRVARAASLPEDFFTGTDSGQLADQFGDMIRLTVSSMMVLLQARNEAKRLTRSTTQTTIQATENNPLKFSPTPEDAMRILFGPRNHSYLDAHRAFAQGFDDLKSHQLKTYMAMQHAVTMLVADLDPAEIGKDVEADGIIDKMRSRKSRLWDAFLIRWKANLGRDKGAAIEAFMLHFADYYDQDGRIDSR